MAGLDDASFLWSSPKGLQLIYEMMLNSDEFESVSYTPCLLEESFDNVFRVSAQWDNRNTRTVSKTLRKELDERNDRYFDIENLAKKVDSLVRSNLYCLPPW